MRYAYKRALALLIVLIFSMSSVVFAEETESIPVEHEESVETTEDNGQEAALAIPEDGQEQTEPDEAIPGDGQEQTEPDEAIPGDGQEQAEPDETIPGDGQEQTEPDEAIPGDGQEQTEPDEAIPNEESTVPENEIKFPGEDESEDETEPVCVFFDTEPDTAEVIVYPIATEENQEPEAVPMKEGGFWFLIPGEYTYTASAEGYITAEAVRFTVEESEEPLNITIELEEEKKEDLAAFDRSVTTGGVTVTVRADAGVFPKDAVLSVEPATQQEQQQADESIEEIRDENRNVSVSYTFDIKVLDPETGEEIQPGEGQTVKVGFALAEVADENLDTSVYHVKEEAGEMTAEQLDIKVDAAAETVTAASDGFSLYTVEFTYGDLQYVLEGGESIPLKTILDTVELKGEATAVTVSNEDLFRASNDSGEWMIESIVPFSSTEWMEVTIDKMVYKIKVTDAQTIIYLDENGNEHTINEYTIINSNIGIGENTWTGGTQANPGYYVAAGDITLRSRVIIEKSVNLILCNNAELKIYGGINVEGTNSLKIYAQSTKTESMGKLEIVIANNYQAGIGGGDREDGAPDCGDIVINGGKISAHGGRKAAGIGGGWGGSAKVTINSGMVWAEGGEDAAGIGGGKNGNGGTININGGTIESALGGDNGAGIGGGANIDYGGKGGTINITGGTIKNATGGKNAAGIGGGSGGDSGYITIDGNAEITLAKGGKNGAGIGGGRNSSGKDIRIKGGTIKEAAGGSGASGIGGGSGGSGGFISLTGGKIELAGGSACEDNGGGGAGIGGGSGVAENKDVGHGGTIIVKGCEIVKAQGGLFAAGIGGGYNSKGGEIIIESGTIGTAQGGNSGAGIGGGCKGSGGNITISGGTISAIGGDNGMNDSKGGAGIGGGGEGGRSGNITIILSAHIVKAESGKNAAGIGGGQGGGFDSISIEDNATIDSAASTWRGAGIGTGCDGGSNNGVIAIKGGEITASGNYGAGIGGGDGSDCGTIRISNGKINATGETGIGNGDYYTTGQEVADVSGEIYITGGNIYAKGGQGAGIGGNEKRNTKKIAISNGEIEAHSVYGAGIGGAVNGKKGEIVITGGTITLAESTNGAGIGSGYKGSIDTILIQGGKITADSTAWGAGIGGGTQSDGGTIIIEGNADVKTKGSGNQGAGIGGGGSGDGNSRGGSAVIIIRADEDGNEPTVNARASTGGAGIGSGFNGEGGKITISAGKITASGGGSAAGIGGGGNNHVLPSETIGSGGEITITGGDITTESRGGGAGIGGGSGFNMNGELETGGSGGKIEIKGGTIKATGKGGGAGIGGGARGKSGEISITGGTVTAKGQTSYYKFKIKITSNSEFTISETAGGAGIGGGVYAPSVTISISGGEVTAYALANGDNYNASAGIGGGDSASGGNIELSGGSIVVDGDHIGIGCGLTHDDSDCKLTLTYTNASRAGMSVKSDSYYCKMELLKPFSDGKGNSYQGILTNEEKETIGSRTNATIVPGSSAYYLDLDGNMIGPKSCIVVLDDLDNLSEAEETKGWYMASGSEDISNTINVSGKVNLILCDNANLNLSGGIYLTPGSELIIWAQSDGSERGKLTVGNGAGSSCIGGSGMITVNGGDIEAKARGDGANGIDIGESSMTVNRGGVTAEGENGIVAGGLTIKKGRIDAAGSDGNGIKVYNSSSDAELTVSGGSIDAMGSSTKAGILVSSASENGDAKISVQSATVEASGAKALALDAPNGNATLHIDNMSVYDSTSPDAVPVAAAERETTCKEKTYAKITPCGTNECPHAIDRTTGKCSYCDKVIGHKVTLVASPAEGGTVKARVGDETTYYTEYLYAVQNETVNVEVIANEGYYIASGSSSFVMRNSDRTVTMQFATEWAALQNEINRRINIDVSNFAGADKTITAPASESALYVRSGRNVKLDLAGCTIDRGLAEKDAEDDGNVIIVEGTLTVKDSSSDGFGKITGGNTTGSGGGVVVQSGATLNMEGGTITGNNAVSEGGGVTVPAEGTFNMKGGTITGNTAAIGGGVFVESDSSISVSGEAMITGNKKNAGDDAVSCNVFLKSGEVITVAGDLGTNALFGVTAETEPIKDLPVVITDGLSGKGEIANFVSDVKAYDLWENSDGEAILAIPPNVTIEVLNPDSGSVTADRDPAVYYANETVTLTITPAKGKRLVEISVKDADGEPVSLNGTGNTRTLKMGQSDVTVTAEFGDIPPEGPTINGVAGLTGSNALTYGYPAGSKVSVSASAPDGHTISGYQWYSCDSKGGKKEKIDGADQAGFSVPKGKTIGNYYYCCEVTAKRDDNGLASTALSGVAKVTVNRKKVTIKGLSAYDKVYDGTTDVKIKGTASLSWKNKGDDVSIKAGSARFDNKNAGSKKTVTFSGYELTGKDAPNYSLTGQPAEVKAAIKAKTVTVKAAAKKKNKGAKDPKLTYRVTGLIGNDKLTGALKRVPGEASGRYAIRQGTLKASGNYAITYKGADLTILAPKPNYTLLAKMKPAGQSALMLTWSKVKDADGYDVYFVRCGTSIYNKIATLDASCTSYKITGLKRGIVYKAYVKAWKKKKDGKSFIGSYNYGVHAITGGYNKLRTDAKSVVLNRQSVTLAPGGSTTFKATTKRVKSDRELVVHCQKIRWFSSNTNVAKVDINGKVTAVAEGTCMIYAVANNGERGSAKVTVS